MSEAPRTSILLTGPPYWNNPKLIQTVYPGILNYHGENTIALSVWTQDAAGGSVSVELSVLGVVSSSFEPGATHYLRPRYTDRSAYY